MRAKVRIETMTDINKFVRIAEGLPGKIRVSDGNDDCRVNAKSLVGVMASMEWDNIILESDEDYYYEFRDFII